MTNKRVVAGIQARMLSERLPGKVLLELGGIPILEHVIRAIRNAGNVDEVHVLTGPRENNSDLQPLCDKLQVPLFFGDEQDVQSRFITLASSSNADYLLRLTADNPLVQPATIRNVAETLLSGQYDYASNCLRQESALGLNVEGMSAKALLRIRVEADGSEQEHVTLGFKRRPDKYRTCHLPTEGIQAWPEMRLTVDEKKDFLFVESLFDRFGEGIQDLDHVLDYLKKHPEAITNADVSQKLA